MKHLIYIVAAMLMVAACTSAPQGNQTAEQQQSTDSIVKKGSFKFDTTVFNFGNILEGEQVSTEFVYTNVGDADIIISKIETSCGCTVPEYDKDPVKPGNRGSIRVRFDSNGKSGTQYKTIRIFSNSEEDIFELVITGEVKHEL
ncbi:MAG: DUF1573 domain-containing protein [Bacteroidales bacterium]|nr:DUF1573 domain-containing protein [Bacteroidales bacterium]MDD6001997.1 DUF1573 domain-containing protein [Bacteroidales bacterium]